MTKTEAIVWYKSIQNGDGPSRAMKEYRMKFGVGRIAEDLWDDNTFGYDVEYGILIALAKAFDFTKEDV